MKTLKKLLATASILVLLPATSFAAVSSNHLLTALSNTGATSYTTASISPTNGRLDLACFASQVSSGGVNIPTATGLGLTWVQVATVVDTETGNRRVTLFRARGTPTTGTMTFDLGGQSQVRAGWSTAEFAGTDISGANGVGAIVQSNASTTSDLGLTTGATTTLNAFLSAADATYGCVRQGAANAFSAGVGGFSLLGNVTGLSSYASEFQNSNNTAVAFTWASSNSISNIIGVEIRAAPANPPSTMMMGAAF
jgi:hypothetical protein